VTGRLNGADVAGPEVPVAGDATLRIRSDGESYEFRCAQGAWEHVLATFPHTVLSTESAGGFTGVLLGLVNEAPASAAPLTFGGVRYGVPASASDGAGAGAHDE
jgi:alpha-N-arabinofuranosidase